LNIRIKTLISIIIISFVSFIINANNLIIENIELENINSVEGSVNITFDIYWENSWKINEAPANWDAVWIFSKWKTSDMEYWSHCTLSEQNQDYEYPEEADIDSNHDGVGFFIFKSNYSHGTNDWNGIHLKWIFINDGLSINDSVSLKLFGIEMVYIPQNSFYVGDASNIWQDGQFENGSTNNPFLIDSEDEITLGGGLEDNLNNINATGMDVADDFDYQTTQTLTATFPKGFDPFYCMKYELSQGFYVEFLNALTYDQSLLHRYGGTSYRYSISGSHPNYYASRPDRACNFLSWISCAAFTDWTGLRPMTELEFEKACRGTIYPSRDEYAWGNAIHTKSDSIFGFEDGTETTNGNINIGPSPVYFSGGDGGYGPLRCGIYADATSSREEAGATYYGIMEMSGNLWERTVTVGNPEGRSFTGIHGDGELSENGYGDVENWPGFIDGEITASIGSGFRGGAFNYCPVRNRVSSRWSINRTTATATYFRDGGFRAVRSIQ